MPSPSKTTRTSTPSTTAFFANKPRLESKGMFSSSEIDCTVSSIRLLSQVSGKGYLSVDDQGYINGKEYVLKNYDFDEIEKTLHYK